MSASPYTPPSSSVINSTSHIKPRALIYTFAVIGLLGLDSGFRMVNPVLCYPEDVFTPTAAWILVQQIWPFSLIFSFLIVWAYGLWRRFPWARLLTGFAYLALSATTFVLVFVADTTFLTGSSRWVALVAMVAATFFGLKFLFDPTYRAIFRR